MYGDCVDLTLRKLHGPGAAQGAGQPVQLDVELLHRPFHHMTRKFLDETGIIQLLARVRCLHLIHDTRYVIHLAKRLGIGPLESRTEPISLL